MSLNEAAQKPHDRLAAALAEDMDAVNQMIRARMASEHAPRIPQVTAHLIEAGGKRLRPMLTLAAARLCGYGGPYHVHLAATVEFIHTATLLHDDVVDESERRRGRPTANLLWDNKSSVLVGDYLFARAFQLMVEPGNLRVLDILANASATIAEGEVLQLTAAQDLATTEEIYLKVVRGKTAALFSAATESGAEIAGASKDAVQALFTYGDALGIAAVTTAMMGLCVLLGTGVALLRLLPLPPLRAALTLYVEVFRNIPVLLQLLMWYLMFTEILPASSEPWEIGPFFLSKGGLNFPIPEWANGHIWAAWG